MGLKFGGLAKPVMVWAAVATLAGSALAQTAPGPAAKAAPVYAPTSLKVEAGVPRGGDGKLDLQGVWESPYIGGLGAIPLVTPAELVITDAQSKAAHESMLRLMRSAPGLALDPEILDLIGGTQGFPVVRGERRSRVLVMPADGKMPLTAAAQAEVLKAGQELMSLVVKADNPEERPSAERCIDMGGTAPMQAPNAFTPLQIVQTRNHIVFAYDGGGEARIIPFTRTHGPAALAPPMGDSIAWWEGDTLVIETVSSPNSKRLRVSPFGGIIVNADAKVTERLTRVSRDEILYQFTVDDPKVFSGPWLGEFSMYRSDYKLTISGTCHEANYAMANILAGARYEDKNPPKPWDSLLAESAGEPPVRWTQASKNAGEQRSWAVLAKRDAADQAQVALRIERALPTAIAGAPPSLSEMDVFALDCAGQRLKMTALNTYAGRNLTGEKSANPPTGDWHPAAQRINLVAGVREACS